jgi:hypothetical protein
MLKTETGDCTKCPARGIDVYRTTEGLMCQDCLTRTLQEHCERELDRREWPDEID